MNIAIKFPLLELVCVSNLTDNFFLAGFAEKGISSLEQMKQTP